ncbi:MAG: RNA polymerase sigma factor [Thermoguttaceae bacterium]|jgi:RNA polymerase sigma-70 factor (ECF subfamily)
MLNHPAIQPMQNQESQADDLSLARRTAAGDQSALALLYERYADPLFAFICHYMGGSRADAEEIWQDTLLAATQSMESYNKQSRFFTWLCGIARHKIADRLRCRGKLAIVFSQVSNKQLAALLEKGPLPEDILAGRETRLRVVEALAELPAEYRTALTARYAQQRSVDEVARLLGKTYKAAESVLSRARTAFRTILSQKNEDEDNERSF